MTDEDEQTVVKTYVPRSQKEVWVEHAASLGMSQSEFLRTMVQAGRRGFDPAPEDTDSPDVTPGGQALEEQVFASLSEAGVLDWDELVARLVGAIERDVDDALGALQNEQRVRYSGRHGGYVVVGDVPPLPDSGHEAGTGRPTDRRDSSRTRDEQVPERTDRGSGRRESRTYREEQRRDRRPPVEPRRERRRREPTDGRREGRPPDWTARSQDDQHVERLRAARERLDDERTESDRVRPADERYDEY